jgi:precorrin-6B methylase 2
VTATLANEAATLSPDKILQTGLAFWPSRTLLTAVEMNVFGTLASGPMTLESLRSTLALHKRGARDFLDTLVALGFLERDGVDLYRNAAEADAFLDPAKPSYVGGILEMAGRRLYPFWNRLGDALRTGERQNETRDGGADFFGDLYADPQRLDGFLRAMTGVSRGANLAIARQFPWHNYDTFADVGTAQGDLAVQIALANPHLTGIGFDLPQVKATFDRYAQQTGVGSRVKFAAGSFFTDPLPEAEVVLMGHILHDWNLAEKRMLLKKAYDALPAGGAVVIYDAIIDDDRRANAFGLMMSLNMLIETPGGFDYTGADCCSWLWEAGFRETRVEHLVGPDSMVVGIK